jgi:hypothetical protein
VKLFLIIRKEEYRMARSSSVMQQESVDTAWIDAPITVSSDGHCSVDINIHAVRLPSVCNTRENTKVACPDAVLPPYSEDRSAALAGLVASEKKVNAKHFIVTRYAGEYLQHLNGEDDPNYTNNLVKKTNLYFAELDKFNHLASNPSIEIVDPANQKMCAELSGFQQEVLPWFRQLSDEANIQKTRERYDLAAFNSRVASPEIVVFALKKDDKLLGTITLNLHTTSDAIESERLGYLSDLFVARGLDDNAEFMAQFMSGVFAKISERFSHLKVLSVMAAAGDLQTPIAKCFEHAKKAGLIQPFTRADQERLGVIAQFTLDDKNAGNTHLPPLPLGTLPILSLFGQRNPSPGDIQALPSLSESSAYRKI